METALTVLVNLIALGRFPGAVKLPLSVDAAAVIDEARVKKHHAILPTAAARYADLEILNAGEKAVLNLIVERLFTATTAGDAHGAVTAALFKDFSA